MFRQIVLRLSVLVLLGSTVSCYLMDDLLAGIPKEKSNISIPLTPCEEQLVELLQAADKHQSWALKALDASPRELTNFMLGQSHFLGNADTCQAVNMPILKDLTNNQVELLRETAPFDFEYQVAYIQANSPWQLMSKLMEPPMLHIGLCLPKICQTHEVENMINNALANAESWQRWQMEPKLVYTKTPKLSDDFFDSGVLKLFLLVLGLNAILLTVPTMGFAQDNRLLQCFNVHTNWQRLFKEPQPDKENSTLNGLRVFCAFNLLAVHVVWYKYYSVDPSYKMAHSVSSATMRHTYWPFLMEMFFVMSAYLTVSNFLGNEKMQKDIAEDNLTGNILRYIRQVFHRYIRLVPLEFVCLLMVTVIFTYLRQVSFFHIVEPVDQLCTKYWWRNALFIQNLFSQRQLCANWTWSLGCDMQLHLVFLLFLFIHARHPKFMRSTIGVLVIVNLIYTWLLMQNVTPNFESFYLMGDYFYTTPIVRFLTYTIGCVYGYWHAYDLPLSPFHYVFSNIWRKLALLIVCLALAVRFQTGDLPSIGLVLFTMIALRLLVSAAAGEIILYNSKPDLAKYVEWFLNLLRIKWVQKASRVTYAIYLLNPIVILSFNYMLTQTLGSDPVVIILLILGYSVLIYLLAIIFTLLIEIPYNRLSSLMLMPTSKAKET